MYRHTQFGTLVVWGGGTALLVILVVAARTSWNPVAVAVALVLTAALFLFHSLTVELAGGLLIVRFGPGLIRRSFEIRSIRAARTVRNHWYYGWGIRLTPHGWLFNVSGFDAVEIELEGGKKFRIGTDRPEELLAAVRAAREHAS